MKIWNTQPYYGLPTEDDLFDIKFVIYRGKSLSKVEKLNQLLRHFIRDWKTVRTHCWQPEKDELKENRSS